MAALDFEVVEQRYVVGGVAMPAIVGTDRSGRLAGIALVHADNAEGIGERLDGVPW